MVPKFPAVRPSFHTVLKERVSAYFESQNISTTGGWRIFSKALLLVSVLILLYIHLVFFTPVWYWAILECILVGFVISFIGFNVMHDGAHGSFSKYPWVNKVAAFSLNLLGGSAFMWNMKHNVIHHAFTNVHEVDDDLNAGFLLRLSEHQKRYKVHSAQHYYFWVLYAQLYLFWIFYSDYKKYFTGKIGNIPLKKMKLQDHLIFWKSKMAFLAIYILIPILFAGWLPWLIGFITITWVAGVVLSIVFQLAHTVEHTHFPLPDDATGKMGDEWAIHQLKTTANFATGNRIISWMVGGLNFQVEHHLFPRISHIHYPAISKIVKQACEEYGVVYNEYGKMRHAIRSHIRYLRSLGRGEVLAVG
jgi:linoleoyl-CoA desaturase